MNVTLLFFLFLFWTPVVSVSIFNLIWDLYFWQTCEYQFSKFYQKLKWDNEISHRRRLLNWAKLFAAILVLTYLLDSNTLLPAIGICVSFAVWCEETLGNITKISKRHYPHLKFNIQNSLAVSLSILASLAAPIMISLVFIATPSTIQTNIISKESLDLFYLFLVWSTITALALDLGSPIIATLFVLLAQPFQFLSLLILQERARTLLATNKQLISVVVIGSYGKTSIKRLSTRLLNKTANVVSFPTEKTNYAGLVRGIIRSLKSASEVLIVDINPNSVGELRQMLTLLEPKIAILTGLGEESEKAFGSIEQGTRFLRETIQYLASTGLVIANGNDELIRALISSSDAREIIYRLKDKDSDEAAAAENELEVNELMGTLSAEQGETISLSIATQAQNIPVITSRSNQSMVHSILASIALAQELAVPWDTILDVLRETKLVDEAIDVVNGDNDTTLVIDYREPTLKQIKNLIHLSKNTGSSDARRILVTTGIKSHGAQRTKLTKQLAQLLVGNFSLVLTTDRMLQEKLHQNNTSLQALKADSLDELVYLVRSHVKPRDVIVISGELGKVVTAELKSNLS